ncbi:MAG: diguanylate cyclase domain-containing protein, partial [bacterium]
MNTKLDNEFRKVGLESAKIFSTQLDEIELYSRVASYIIEELKDIIANVRIYIKDNKGERFKEKIACHYNGVEPGYDSIPVYQLPGGLYEKQTIKHNKRDVMTVVKDGEQVIGLLDLKINLPMPEGLLESINLLAEGIGIGISNYLHKNSNIRSKKLTDVVVDINSKMQNINNLDILIEEFMLMSIIHFRFDRATIFLYDKEGKIFFSRCYNERGKSYRVNTIPKFPDISDGYCALENTSGYWFPLKANRREVGFILFDNIYSLYNLKDSDLDILRILCSQVSSIIDNVRLLTDLKESAYYDKLTGLYNRRYFDKKIDEYDRADLLPFSLIIGDVNGLKVTNDVFGHQVGDNLLISISNILQKSCRENDTIVRWGGDEFILLLPNADEMVADHICNQIKELCSNNNEHKIQLSISLGMATRNNINEAMNRVIKVAEDRMYRQKLKETKSFRSDLISSLKETMLEKCYEPADHSERMADLAIKLGKMMGLYGNDLDDLKSLAMLHDIGKVAVDNVILSKPGPLNDDEWI